MALTTVPASVYTDAGGDDMAKKNNPEVMARARAKYDKMNTVGMYLKLNLNTDMDILARLDDVASGETKQGYIKRLIREDIARGL